MKLNHIKTCALAKPKKKKGKTVLLEKIETDMIDC